MPAFPFLQSNDDLVVDSRYVRHSLVIEFNVNIMQETGIIRYYIEELFRLLQRSDYLFVGSFQDFDHLALATSPLTPRTQLGHLLSNDPSEHFIAMHRGTGVFSRDINIAQTIARRVENVTESLWIHLQDARNEICLLRQDITFLTDPSNFALLFKIAQQTAERGALIKLDPKALPEICLIERLILGMCQQIEQTLAKRLNAVFLRTHWKKRK